MEVRISCVGGDRAVGIGSLTNRLRGEPELADRPLTLRQLFCPEHRVLLAAQIASADEPSFRRWSVTR